MNINNDGWSEWEKYTTNSDIISCEIDFGVILLSNGVTVKSYDFPAKYPNYKLKELESVTDTTTYTITFYLTKEDGEWKLQDISDQDREKIHGLYEG